MAAGAETVTTGPECSKVSPLALSVLGKIPAPPSNQLCSWLLKGVSGLVTTCQQLAIIETGLSRTSGGNQSCNTSDPQLGQYPLTGSPAPLEDARPLPPGAFANVSDVYEEEGATFHWLYQLVRNLENSLPCSLEGLPWQPPQGWALHTTLRLTEGGGQRVPFGAVIVDPASSQIVVALRGTMTGFEWGLDWQYNQTTTTPDVFGVPVHAGFGGAFSEVWPDIEAALQELVVANSTATQVFVVGHSLGAAVATLASYAAQSYLDEQLGEGAPVVGAVLVAPPNVAGPAFVAEFDQRVNARRLAFQFDIVPQAFCTPTMPACGGASADASPVGALLAKAGVSVMPTNMPGNVSAWNCSQVGGGLPIAGDDMPQDAAAWPALQSIQLCWAVEFLLASHVCSYTCFTSQFAADADAAARHSNCWLSPKPGGAEGSACMGWPSAYPGMEGAAAAPSPQ